MSRTPERLREDLLAIWNAGVDGVLVDRLIRRAVSLHDDSLQIGDMVFPLSTVNRLVVVGGGKASGAMAETLESVLEPLFDRKEILGWINVPEDCAKPLRRIYLHPARPMGINEPTEAAAAGTEKMIRLLESLTPGDLCLNLLSGGGSALLPAPVPDISLQDKLEVTRFLSESGATIQELNTVRKQLSRIKGGGMKALCHGKRLVSLILSDVLGDPLDIIASGPTVDNESTATDALSTLLHFDPGVLEDRNADSERRRSLHRIASYLQKKAAEPIPSFAEDRAGLVQNLVIGNNADAVEAAGMEALRRGYSHAMHVSRRSESLAEEVGVNLARLAEEMRYRGPDCLIHGGEPVVRLAPAEIRGKGGRNQQLVLASLIEFLACVDDGDDLEIALLSGGTDGEDGPTDAAGAWIDPIIYREIRRKMKDDPGFDPRDFLKRNDAYRFFEPFGTLIKTGSTGTNVCDLRVVLVARTADPAGEQGHS